MKLYIKSAQLQPKSGFMVYNSTGEEKYSVPVEHSVLGIKLDVNNALGKRVSKIRQHGFSFNKTYNISAGERKFKLILKVQEDNISAFIKGYAIAIVGDILRKEFSLINENKAAIMTHKDNFKNYYELDILQDELELLSICVSLCIETLLLNDEKIEQKARDNAFFAKYILNNKKILGPIRETFSANVNKLDELKKADIKNKS